MYNKFRKVRIDEEKSICNLSITTWLKQFDVKWCEKYEKGGWISRKYYKTDEESLTNFVKALERYLKKIPANDITKSQEEMKEIAGRILARILKKKERQEGRK